MSQLFIVFCNISNCLCEGLHIYIYIENAFFLSFSSDSCGIPASVISNVTSVPFAAKVKAVMVDFCSVGASLEVRREI